MKSRFELKRNWPIQFKTYLMALSAVLMFRLAANTAYSATVVTNCTEADLRAAMAGGGTVTFACDGTITLGATITNATDTVLDASGHQITISGSNAVRVFYVNTNVTFTMVNLTIANGRAARGAGILNAGGTVNATSCTFIGNCARGAAGTDAPLPPPVPGQDGCGGAVDNSGVVNAIDCSFTGNSALGGGGGAGADIPAGTAFPGGPGGIGFGGAVCNSGLLTASGCSYSSNSATGGVGGRGGGAAWNAFGRVDGGNGGAGGSGNGGALFNGGIAYLVNCTLALNTGAGADGGLGGRGGGFPYIGSPGQNGSPGLGVGGICDVSGQCRLTNCTVAYNSCAGASYSPGSSSCGGIKTSGATLVNTLLSENMPGGNGSGAITDLGHNLSSDNSCAFTGTGSLNATYPLLGPLSNNGGPTATIALMSGSPAIDAGDNQAAPATDQRGVLRPFGAASDIGAYEYDSPTNPLPSKIVTVCTEANLRAAMASGGTVSFACDGTIALANTIILGTNTALNATGHQITISGGNSVRVFYVNSNVSFTVINLTIANGSSDNGAGIFNNGGTLVLLDAVLRTNAANVGGGALFNRGGLVNATNCAFYGNYANLSESTRGGAMQNESGEVNLLACVFAANRVSAPAGASVSVDGTGGPGGSGWGGALHNAGTLWASLCSFIDNSAIGGAGGSGGNASYYTAPRGDGGSGGASRGGAVYNVGAMTISRSTFSSNSASGGTGGLGGGGGHAHTGNGGPGGNGGGGGDGRGGAIFNAGAARLINCTFSFNRGVGGNGANGGMGGAGGTMGMGGPGGNGGAGGSGFGAILDQSACWVTNCTLAFNGGTSGAGGAGGPSNGPVPGSPGASGLPGSASGGITTPGATLVNTLLAANTPGNNTDPKLGPLADNGGPTLTMALLPGSPAIDAGDDTAAPPTDQRGYRRPVGTACDIGAFEFGGMPAPTLLTTPATQTAELGFTVRFAFRAAGPALTCQWFCDGQLLTGCTNSVLCQSDLQASHAGSYTVVVSNAGGSVTSTPALLSLIPAVERRPVPTLYLAGQIGSALNLDYADTLNPSANWLWLDSVTLANSPQVYFDLSSPLPPQRFYRAWQSGSPGVLPSLSLPYVVPAITMTGNLGDSLRLDYINALGPTDAWVTLDTVTLTNTSQLYLDTSAPGQPRRLYRIVPVP